MPNSENNRSDGGSAELLADVLAGEEVELDLLLRHAREPETLTPAERDRVEAYLAASPAHRDRARVMTRIAASSNALGALGIGAEPAAAGHPSGQSAMPSSGAEVIPLARFRRPSVLFALAASIAITLLGVGVMVRWLGGEGAALPQFVEEPAPPTPDGAPDERKDSLEPEELKAEDATMLAEEPPGSPPLPIPAPHEPLRGDGNSRQEGVPERLAEVEPGVEPRRLDPERPEAPVVPVAQPTPGRVLEEEGEPILLAAMLSAGPLDYVRPTDFDELVRIEGHLRSAISEPLVVSTLAPRELGLTLEASPTLYWFASRVISEPIEVIIINTRDRISILRVPLPPVDRAGVRSIDLSELGVELETGVDYRWMVAVVHDPERRGRDTVAAAEIRRIEATDAMASMLRDAAREERGHVLARGGIWYDALAFLSREIDRVPDEDRLRARRGELLRSVGLEEAAAQDGVTPSTLR